jgi:hypothetical protein
MGMLVSVHDYIRAVCGRNRLVDTADWFLKSNGGVYYVDRHVDVPPEGMSVDAACQAGLALLEQWAYELEDVRKRGLFATNPLLIIDDEWLLPSEEAPPPHVMVTLATQMDLLQANSVHGERVDVSEFPLWKMLNGRLRFAHVTRIEPSLERESQGAWAIEIDA